MGCDVAIVGAGLIGKKRAMALSKLNDCQLVVTVDVNQDAAKGLAQEFGGEVETDWQKVVARDDIDVVIVATVNKFLAPISIAALRNGKHVLCEKPLGRNPEESRAILEATRGSGVILKTGFNHRHHSAVAQAKQLFDTGTIGDLYFMRCRYGHGGRPGYDTEWRANKDLCGGGELLDQGVHVVDLFRWFAGDFNEAFGYTTTFFWDTEVEDNAFAMFKRDDGVIASMHTSWTQWKNLFCFEVYGVDGYLVVEGLGGSYGPEVLKVGKRKKIINTKSPVESNRDLYAGGVPKEEVIAFDGPDISWEEELREFISAIKSNSEPTGNGWDGYQASSMIEAVYESARTGKAVEIGQYMLNASR